MKNKKCLSLWLAIIMALSLLPCTAFAGGDSEVVASIGNDGYLTLQEAFDAAPDGKETTIVLERDFDVNQQAVVAKEKNIILDMNGMTIRVGVDFEGRPIANRGTLTLTGNGTIDTTQAPNGYGAVDNYGSLTIKNGTYKSYVYAGGSVIKNRPYSRCEIEDGTFYGSPTAVYNEGITKIYGGRFEGHSCSACNSNWGYTIQSHWNDKSADQPQLYFYDGTVIGVQGAFSSSAGYTEIHDGKFETVSCENHPDGSSAWYALYVAGESGVAKCTVYGGEFKALTKYAVYVGNSNDGGEKLEAVMRIEGGSFTSGRSDEAVYVDKSLGGLEIVGGSYYLNDGTPANVSEWLVDGFIQDNDGAVVHNHASYATKVEEKQATCAEAGNRAYWYCENCDKYFSDDACTEEITLEQTILPALGHNYVDGVCSRCGDKIEVEAPEIDGTKPVEEVQVGLAKEQQAVIEAEVADLVEAIESGEAVTGVSEETAKIISEAISEGASISFEVVYSGQIEATEQENQLILEAIEKGETVAELFDLSIILKVDGEEVGAVHKLTDKVTFQLALPDEMIKDGRTYSILRIHEGKVEKLPTELIGKQLVFETDRFSTYAIVYADKIEEEGDQGGQTDSEDDGKDQTESKEDTVLPDTGDSNNMALTNFWIVVLIVAGVAIIALAIVLICVNVRKKKKS